MTNGFRQLYLFRVHQIIQPLIKNKMTPEEIIEHNRNLIQKVLGRPFMYKPFAPYETREEFEKQVDERREAEYLERVYGIKNEFRNMPKYPYPKKARLKYKDSYLDGGTKEFKVLNEEEIGLRYIYQDFRLSSTAKGKFYTGYPGYEDSEEIVSSFVEIEEDCVK